MNINLNRNTLVSYHPDTGFKSVEKYQTNYPWINFIIKCFRYFFHPEFRIANVVDGLKVKARQLSTDQDKFSYLKFARLFKEQVIDQHNQQAGLFRKVIDTQELDAQLDRLAEEILGTEVVPPLREQLKDYILNGKLPNRWDINVNTVLDFIRLSQKCKIWDLENFAGGAVEYVLDQLKTSSAPINLETVKSVLPIYRIGSERMQKSVNRWLDSQKVKALGVYQLAQIPKEERPPKLQEICENAFIQKHSDKWRKLCDERTDEANFDVLKRYLLSQTPEDMEILLDEAINFGLDKSIDTFFSVLVDYSVRLCVYIPADKVEENKAIVQRYLKVLQNCALKVHAARPENHLYQMIASLFNGRLLQPEEGQELFKSIISFCLWDMGEFWNDESRMPSYSRYSEDTPCKKKHPLRNLTAAENIRLGNQALRFANHFGLNPLKTHLLRVGFPYHLVLNKVEQELPSLEEDKKQELIHLMRTQLYPLIPSMAHRFNDFAKRIIAIEQNLRSTSPTLQFNDPNTSDIQFKLSNGSLVYLHKQVLETSPYFKALLEDKFKESHQKVITHHEENALAFIELIQYLYDGKLWVDEGNVLDILPMAEKYQIEPLLLVQCHVYKWITDNLYALKNQIKEDGISLEAWNGLLQFAQTLKDDDLVQDICSYVFLSLNRYAESQRANTEAPLTNEQFEERKAFLQQHGRLMRKYESPIDPALRDFVRAFMPNQS